MDFSISGHNYRAGKLNAFQQLHLTRKLAPIIPQIFPTFMAIQAGGLDLNDLEAAVELFEPVTRALADMPQADCDFVFETCLKAIKIEQPTGYTPIWNDAHKTLIFDIDLVVMTQLVFRVLQHNLGSFMPGLLKNRPQAGNPEAN